MELATVTEAIDKFLGDHSAHQFVPTSDVADFLLDLRLLLAEAPTEEAANN